MLKQLRREGFKGQQITILSRYRLERSIAQAGLEMPIKDISRGGLDFVGNEITFSTVSSFKGLEAEVVLLVDVDDLSSPDGLISVYVGASRARVVLHVFISEQVRDQFVQHAHVFGSRAIDRNLSEAE